MQCSKLKMQTANTEQPLRKMRGVPTKSIVELKWNPKPNQTQAKQNSKTQFKRMKEWGKNKEPLNGTKRKEMIVQSLRLNQTDNYIKCKMSKHPNY